MIIKSRKERRQEWKNNRKNYHSDEEYYQSWNDNFVITRNINVPIIRYSWEKEKLKEEKYKTKCEERRKLL